MPTQFRTASRSLEDIKTASQTLDEMFECVKGKGGRVDPRGVGKLDAAKYDISELIVQLINDQYLLTDPTPFMAEMVTGDIRNNYVFREQDSTLRVVPRAYGTKPLSQRITYREYGMTTTSREVAVELPLEEIAAGSTTASTITSNIAAALNRAKISMVLDAIDAACTAATADRTGVSGYTLRYLGLTDANLSKAVDGLYDEAESPRIFARHIALYPAVRAFSGWSQDTLRELEQRGVVGQFRGASIVTLRDQYSKIDGAHLIPSNRVYLAGANKGAKVMDKDVSFLNWSMVDPRSSTFGTGVRVEWGVLVHDAYQYRVLEV